LLSEGGRGPALRQKAGQAITEAAREGNFPATKVFVRSSGKRAATRFAVIAYPDFNIRSSSR
jgi:hypothetical protein